MKLLVVAFFALLLIVSGTQGADARGTNRETISVFLDDHTVVVQTSRSAPASALVQATGYLGSDELEARQRSARVLELVGPGVMCWLRTSARTAPVRASCASVRGRVTVRLVFVW